MPWQLWHLYIVNNNGEKMELPLARVNYTLRAAVIPAGHHQLVMEFQPYALQLDKWSLSIMILSILLSLVGLAYPLWKKDNKDGNTLRKTRHTMCTQSAS